jgi:hypothetical protein
VIEKSYQAGDVFIHEFSGKKFALYSIDDHNEQLTLIPMQVWRENEVKKQFFLWCREVKVPIDGTEKHLYLLPEVSDEFIEDSFYKWKDTLILQTTIETADKLTAQIFTTWLLKGGLAKWHKVPEGWTREGLDVFVAEIGDELGVFKYGLGAVHFQIPNAPKFATLARATQWVDTVYVNRS